MATEGLGGGADIDTVASRGGWANSTTPLRGLLALPAGPRCRSCSQARRAARRRRLRLSLCQRLRRLVSSSHVRPGRWPRGRTLAESPPTVPPGSPVAPGQRRRQKHPWEQRAIQLRSALSIDHWVRSGLTGTRRAAHAEADSCVWGVSFGPPTRPGVTGGDRVVAGVLHQPVVSGTVASAVGLGVLRMVHSWGSLGLLLFVVIARSVRSMDGSGVTAPHRRHAAHVVCAGASSGTSRGPRAPRRRGRRRPRRCEPARRARRGPWQRRLRAGHREFVDRLAVGEQLLQLGGGDRGPARGGRQSVLECDECHRASASR